MAQPASDTDGEIVEIQMLNDYTGSKVKEEMSEYETKGVLQVSTTPLHVPKSCII